MRISVCIGRVARWSTSSRRNWPIFNSSVGNIYESNSRCIKSEYSYLQYHWCPIVLMVIPGVEISSIKYRRRREGRARNKSTIAGRMVQIVSISCASIILLHVKEFIINDRIAYPTMAIIRVTISMVWSWNLIS